MQGRTFIYTLLLCLAILIISCFKHKKPNKNNLSNYIDIHYQFQNENKSSLLLDSCYYNELLEGILIISKQSETFRKLSLLIEGYQTPRRYTIKINPTKMASISTLQFFAFDLPYSTQLGFSPTQKSDCYADVREDKPLLKGVLACNEMDGDKNIKLTISESEFKCELNLNK